MTKGFVRWAVGSNKLPHSPLERLSKVSTDTDTPVERRAATAAELTKLISTTMNAKPIYHLILQR